MGFRSQLIHENTRPLLDAVKISIFLFSLVQYSPALPTFKAQDNADIALKLEEYLVRCLPQEQDNVIKSAADKLILMGVRRLEQLKYVQAEDLKDVLPVIQIRELMYSIKKDFSLEKEEIASDTKPISIEVHPEVLSDNNVPQNSITEHEEDARKNPTIETDNAAEHGVDNVRSPGEEEGDDKSLSYSNNDYKMSKTKAEAEVNYTVLLKQQTEDDVAPNTISNKTSDNIPNDRRDKLPDNLSRNEAELGKDIASQNTAHDFVPKHIKDIEVVSTTNLSKNRNSSQNTENKNPAEISQQGEDNANNNARSEYNFVRKSFTSEEKHDEASSPKASDKPDNSRVIDVKHSDNQPDTTKSDKISNLFEKKSDQSENQYQKYNGNMKHFEDREKDVSIDNNQEINRPNNADLWDKQNTDLSTDTSKNDIESQRDTIKSNEGNEKAKPQKSLTSAETSDEEETDVPVNNDLLASAENADTQHDDQLINRRNPDDESDLTFHQSYIQNDHHVSLKDGDNTIGVHKEYKLRKMSLNDNVSLGSMNFMTYFVIVSILVAIGYIGLHNKQKIVAVILEGRKGRGKRQKTTTESTQPLVTEVVSTSEKPTSVKNFIY